MLNLADMMALITLLGGTMAALGVAMEKKGAWWVIAIATILGFGISYFLCNFFNNLAYRILRIGIETKSRFFEFIYFAAYMALPLVSIGVTCLITGGLSYFLVSVL